MTATVPVPVRRVLADGTPVIALYPYGDRRVRALLRAYKFRGRTTLRESVAGLVAKGAALGVVRGTLDGTTLVPVPLSSRRERERGFNQAEDIAGFLARELDGAPIVSALKRVRETGQQSKLDKGARRANMVGAFEVARPLPSGRAVTIVDDVVTTGETLSAAVAAARAGGASEVACFALAHAEPDGD